MFQENNNVMLACHSCLLIILIFTCGYAGDTKRFNYNAPRHRFCLYIVTDLTSAFVNACQFLICRLSPNNTLLKRFYVSQLQEQSRTHLTQHVSRPSRKTLHLTKKKKGIGYGQTLILYVFLKQTFSAQESSYLMKQLDFISNISFI